MTNLQVESREWTDTSLGCPREGMMYAQVMTPGYLITIEANGKVYEVHADTRGTMVLCTIDGEDVTNLLPQQ